jgi:hypothetical protein
VAAAGGVVGELGVKLQSELVAKNMIEKTTVGFAVRKPKKDRASPERFFLIERRCFFCWGSNHVQMPVIKFVALPNHFIKKLQNSNILLYYLPS